MSESERRKRGTLKRRLLSLVHAGTGSVVIATSVLAPHAADATRRGGDGDILARAAAARQRLTASFESTGASPKRGAELAWWGNWRNSRSRWAPRWNNWPNWRNWNNWRNRW